MKKFLLFLFVLVLAVSFTACSANETEQAVSSEPTESPVGTEDEPTEVFDFGDISISVPFYEVVKEQHHDSVYEYSNFVYDENDRLIQKECSGDSSYIIDYVYDERGYLVESTETSTYYSSKGERDIYTYTTDDDGHVTTCSEKVIKADGSAGFRDGNRWEYTYEYDESGQVIREISSNTSSDRPNEQIIEYEYDDLGRIKQYKEINYRDGEKKSEYTITPAYDEEGRKIRESVKSEDGKSWSNAWEYEEAGSKEYSVSTGYITSTHMWSTFEEVSGLPTPDSCVTTIDIDQRVSTKYTFNLPSSEKDANIAYYIYTVILKDYCKFTLMTDETGMIFISKDGVVLAKMTVDCEQAYRMEIVFE